MADKTFEQPEPINLGPYDEALTEACPFCGSYALGLAECFFAEKEAAEEGWETTRFYLVICACGGRHGDYPGHSTPEAAVDAWNTRRGPQHHG